MTSTLVIFGASLMDAGNLSHATDGLVLGEQKIPWIALVITGFPEA